MTVMASASAEAEERCVTVKVGGAVAVVPFRTMQGAKLLSTRLYNEIGVSLKWEDASSRRRRTNCAEILVEFESDTAEATLPGAFAYTTPSLKKDTRIHVFVDRVLNGQRAGELAEAYLGYVLAHEIGHVLEGVSRHSEEGVMKPLVPRPEILRNKLSFAEVDVKLIQDGLVRQMGEPAGR
jgi:hypothetical protein